MAQQPKQLVTCSKTFRAGAALAPYRIVKFGADDETVIHGAAASDAMFGVTRPAQGKDPSNMVLTGGVVDIALAGIAGIEAGGNVTEGARVTSDSVGRAVSASSNNRTIGIALNNGVAGDIIGVLLSPGTV